MWRKLLIEKLGGYATAEDAIAAEGGFLTIEDAIEEIRKKDLPEKRDILTLAVKKLFNTIGADDILKPVNGKWTFEGKAMSKRLQDLIMAEAVQFESSTLWKVIQADILYHANKKLFVSSQNIEHVITAKFWLYTFDTIRTRLNSLVAGSALFNAKEKGQK